MKPGIKHILIIAVILLFSCSKPPVEVYEEIDKSRYQIINNDFNWSEVAIDENSIIPIEVIDNELAIYNSEFREGINKYSIHSYGGLLLYVGKRNQNALAVHKFNGIRNHSRFSSNVLTVQKMFKNRPTDINGIVVLLDSIQFLSDEQLKILVSAPVECLILNGLEYLSVDQAEILSTFSGASICLNGLLWLGEKQAEHLSNFKGDYLSLNSVKTIQKYHAIALSNFHGVQLYVAGLDRQSIDLLNRYHTDNSAQIIANLN